MTIHDNLHEEPDAEYFEAHPGTRDEIGPEPGTDEWYVQNQEYDPEPDWTQEPANDWRHGLLYYNDGRVTDYDGKEIQGPTIDKEPGQ